MNAATLESAGKAAERQHVFAARIALSPPL